MNLKKYFFPHLPWILKRGNKDFVSKFEIFGEFPNPWEVWGKKYFLKVDNFFYINNYRIFDTIFEFFILF